jgi:hypothetical protein
MRFFTIVFIILSATSLVFAQSSVQSSECISSDGSKCLTADQFDQVKKALQELDDIHKSPAVLSIEDHIIIISDWDGRVYVNGGDKKPIRMKLKIGQYIDRDMEATLPTEVYYRPKPPDPMFRLRIRAQVGILVPQILQTDSGLNRYCGGLGWDFWHIGAFNAALYTGIRGSGGGIGFDFTRNFGGFANYIILYDGFRSGILTGVYFSFN